MAVSSLLSQRTRSHVVPSPGRGSIRTSSVCTTSTPKYARSLIIALAVSAVCSPVTDSSVSFPVLVLILWLLYFTKDKCPLVAVYVQASGAQHQGYWDTVSGKRLLSQQLTWRRTILLDARGGHPQPLNAEGEERKGSGAGREGFDNQSIPSAFCWCLNISPFFFTDIKDVKCPASRKWQFGVFWGKIFCWKFLISLSPSWDADTWLELVLLCTSHSHTI